MESQLAASSLIQPQEVVHLKDASSVGSGISFEVSDHGPNIANADAAANLFMSPAGKASKKVKKVVKKVKKAAVSAAMEAEVGGDDDNAKLQSVKSGKVKVIKKVKNPIIAKETKLVEIPDASNSNESEDTSKESKTVVKVISAKRASSDEPDNHSSIRSPMKQGKEEKPERNHSSPVKLSDHFGKDVVPDVVAEERSVRTSGSKKKNKRSESFTALSPRNAEVEGRRTRTGSTKKERRSRSKSSDRARSRSKSSERAKSDDDASISRPKRPGKKKSLVKSTEDQNQSAEENASQLDVLRKENREMLEEIVFLRQQLNEVGEDGLSHVDIEQIKMDLKVALSESREMKQEIEDYEVSMVEKDILIKKLTDAVDAQLDKVEHLELKLLRAEEEFCNMEDEMKEMEDVIEILRSSTQEKSHARSNQDLLEQEKALERERLRIQAWEEEVKERESELHSERLLEAERRKLDLKYSSHGKGADETDSTTAMIEELKAKLAETEAQNSTLQEENDRLNQYAKERHEKEQEIQERRDDEIRTIQVGVNKQLQELDDENESLRRRIEAVNEDKKSSEEKLVGQIEELRKDNTRLHERIGLASQRPSTDGDEPSVEYVCELEEEIADLREKIVEYEDHIRRQKEEIALIFVENEEVKQDLNERDSELRDLEAQFSASKEVSGKKIKQKDETICFMQTEMMRIMQEKQKVDRVLREKKLNVTENDLMSSQHNEKKDEEAEKAMLEAINEQLRQLDDENRTLEEKITDLQYTHSMRLKEKQAIILDLQEELNDAKWELGARKEGADYITLLKDRKERKRELDKARKELKRSEERVLDLERENTNLTNIKQDLEKEIDSLNQSVVSMDSGEYVSGLKRQIKSLKQHNMALERKVQVESREAEEKLRLQEAKIRILEHDVEKLKNPTRTAIKSVFSNFGKKDEEGDVVNGSAGIPAQRSEDEGEKSENQLQQVSSSAEANNDGEEKISERIWNLFSPRKGVSRRVRKSGLQPLGMETNSVTRDTPNVPDVTGIQYVRSANELATDDSKASNEEQIKSLANERLLDATCATEEDQVTQPDVEDDEVGRISSIDDSNGLTAAAGVTTELPKDDEVGNTADNGVDSAAAVDHIEESNENLPDSMDELSDSLKVEDNEELERKNDYEREDGDQHNSSNEEIECHPGETEKCEEDAIECDDGNFGKRTKRTNRPNESPFENNNDIEY